MTSVGKFLLAFIPLSLIAVCLGCGKTKTVDILSESKMNVGQQVSCFYVNDNLYCGSPAVKPEDVERFKVMDRVVFAIRSLERHRGDTEKAGEAGTYSTKFTTTPRDYSLWNCNKTGGSEPAVTCALLKNPDPKQVAYQLEQARFQDSLRALTEKTLMNACGNPRTTKSDMISRTLVYPTTHSGVLAEVRFDTTSHDTEPKVDGITTVDEKTGQFYVQGILWGTYTEGMDRITSIKEYLPCLK